MIVEWILGIAASFMGWVADLVPKGEAPDFLKDFNSIVNPFLANLSGVGVWVDWVYCIGVVTVVILVWGISFAVKFVRAVASYVPFVGGAG